MAAELSSLQADTPADPPEQVRATIVEELGMSPDEIFAQFDYTALASASVGQVHRAELPNGTGVVVKVQHAGIEPKVRSDLYLLTTLAQMAESSSRELARYRPTATVEEFKRSLLRELNFGTELTSLLHFQQNFADNPQVQIPIAYPEYSSRRVLTMAMLDGYSIANKERMIADQVDQVAFAELFADTMLDMIFRDGFYHADPHPGNIFVLPEQRLGLLDCGKIGRVDEQTQDDFISIVYHVLDRDAEGLTDELIQMCEVPAELNRSAYQADVAEFLAEFGDTTIGGLDLGTAFDPCLGLSVNII